MTTLSTKKAGETVDADSPLCLERQLCFALYAASNQMTRLARPALDLLGLTYPQYLVLLVLWAHAPCSVSDIGHRLLLDSGTLTPLLKRMECNGLITRTRDTEDERRVLIALSEQGRALKRRACKVPESLRGRIGLPPATLDGLREQLQQLVALLNTSA